MRHPPDPAAPWPRSRSRTPIMRAIIVDDEAPARRRLRGVLQQISTVTRIDECANGREAVELLRRGAPPPDLVFLDIQMPDLDGFAVAAAANQERPPAIVFVTAFEEHAVRAFEIQAFDYLLKPFDDERIIAPVKRGGRVASRLELLQEVWGYAEDVMSRTVDTHVAMLRRKLEHDPAHPRHIVTVRTFGYRIER